jgi:hypothetical protein
LLKSLELGRISRRRELVVVQFEISLIVPWGKNALGIYPESLRGIRNQIRV